MGYARTHFLSKKYKTYPLQHAKKSGLQVSDIHQYSPLYEECTRKSENNHVRFPVLFQVDIEFVFAADFVQLFCHEKECQLLLLQTGNHKYQVVPNPHIKSLHFFQDMKLSDNIDWVPN